jgi:hypothetical protein
MTIAPRTSIALFIAGMIWLPHQAGAQAPVFTYRGMCDASAAAALDADHFVVANDERNQLKIYKRGQADAVTSVDMSGFLGTADDKESDLEGSATIGNRIYWISSHGQNKEGKFQDRRHRLFAMDIKPGTPPSVAAAPATKFYAGLRKVMLADDRLKPFKLAEAAALPPKEKGGFNIEGLAATPDGKLLIGFRNPIPADGALIVPLENPGEVLTGQEAKLGAPILLKGLNGNGIRSIELIGTSYLVVAGPAGKEGSFALHRWSGKPPEEATPVTSVDVSALHPEALFAVSADSVQILSDDGEVNDCKNLAESQQSFRSITVKP